MPEEQQQTSVFQTAEPGPILLEEAPESDVQVELVPEDGEGEGTPTVATESGPEAQAAPSATTPAPKKTRKGNSADERIAKLTKEVSDAANYAMERDRVANEALAQVAAIRAQNQFLTEASIASYEKEATDSLSQAKTDLKRALSEGDMDAVVDAQERLAKAATMASKIGDYKVNARQQPAASKPSQGQAPAVPVRRNPVADSWIERNAWVKNDHDDFDPEKAQDTLTYAENLAKELQASGRGAEVGTSRYFKAIDSYVKETYEDEGEEEITNAPPPAKKAGSPVAPPGRGSAGPLKQDQIRITLSPAEQQVAMMMGLRDQNGTALSKEEHFKAYARSKAADGKHAARDAALAQRR